MPVTLCKKLLHPNTIDNYCCIKVINKIHVNSFERDGFVILPRILGTILLHLGGDTLDVVHEINSLALNKDESMNSLLLQFNFLHMKLQFVQCYVPATVLVQKYFELVMSVSSLRSLLAPLYREFEDSRPRQEILI